MAKGEAMRRQEADSRFQSIWNRISEIQISQSNYVSQYQFQNALYRISELTDILIQAGILIEPTKLGPLVHQVDGKPYAVRKVK
jgi:hypothetical protein